MEHLPWPSRSGAQLVEVDERQWPLHPAAAKDREWEAEGIAFGNQPWQWEICDKYLEMIINGYKLR